LIGELQDRLPDLIADGEGDVEDDGVAGLERLYERLGRNTTAAEHFARAAQLYGDSNPQTLVDLSRTREKAGDTRGALAAIEAYSVAIGKQGSVPHWVVERADALRMKLRATTPRP
jgi:hypothetical protein